MWLSVLEMVLLLVLGIFRWLVSEGLFRCMFMLLLVGCSCRWVCWNMLLVSSSWLICIFICCSGIGFLLLLLFGECVRLIYFSVFSELLWLLIIRLLVGGL